LNIELLIDFVVRQTTVLVAQLATAGGARAPLSHVANQVFVDLAEELRRQGVGRKVSAEMFGMALRTYLRKLRRLSESQTQGGRSLWDAVLEAVSEGGVVNRGQVLARFPGDDPELVAGVLHELCDSGLVFRSGSGARTVFRAANADELGSHALHRGDSEHGEETGREALLWALIYREGPLDRHALGQLVRSDALDATLFALLDKGRIEALERDGRKLYAAASFQKPLQAPGGWEGAVYDHFHAVVKTICAKLVQEPSPHVGGSTYSFEIWAGHPLEDEVLGQLAAFRRRSSELRARLKDYNANHEAPSDTRHVTLYAGQCVIAHDDEETEQQDEQDDI